MAKKKILFINQEISPYVPDNSLSLMGKGVPQAMQELNHEIRTFMPKWGTINERRGQLHEVIRLSGMNLIINDTDHPLIIKVASIQSAKIQVYFIDNDDYFGKRLMEKDEKGEDIIHCQGWMSAVVPLYVKTAYHDEPSFAETKVVTSLFTKNIEKDLGENFKQCLEFREAKSELLQSYQDNFDFDELGKLAIDYSDGIVQADPEVNKDLLNYAVSKNIPVLGYQEDFADAYEKFYEQLFPEEQAQEED